MNNAIVICPNCGHENEFDYDNDTILCEECDEMIFIKNEMIFIEDEIVEEE